MGGMGGMGRGGPPPPPTRKAEPLEYNFNVSLEDLYHGGRSVRSLLTLWGALLLGEGVELGLCSFS